MALLYPNTFYMVTDITHMHFTSTVLWERESMILFMLYVPSILFGVMAGVESLKLIFLHFPSRPTGYAYSYFVRYPSYPVLLSISVAMPD